MKLAEGYCCGKAFAKAKSWSSYLYGLNNRPFGSGSAHTLKERILDIFQINESVDSEIFQKYVARIGKGFDMPVDTRADQQRIFNDISELSSFKHELGQPKFSNWFAWNAMAHVQMRKFSATKCVFGAACACGPDPDEQDDDFDSVSSDTKAQLQAILKSSGRLPLAFRLMSRSQDHVHRR